MPKMTGHRFFAEAMRGYGVSHLFYVNTIIPPAMLEIDKVGGVKRVVTHRRKSRSLYGRWLCTRLEPPRHLPVSGHRQHQPRSGRARRPYGGFAGDRNFRWTKRHAALPPRLSKRRRPHRMGWRHQGQLFGGRGLTFSRPAAAGVSRSHQRRTGTGAPGTARQLGPGTRQGRRLRPHLRAALHAFSAVPARRRRRRHQGRIEGTEGGRQAHHRRRRRRGEIAGGGGSGRARRQTANPHRDQPACARAGAGRSRAGRGRSRHLFALVRKQGRRSCGPGVFYRQPYRRPGHQRLEDPKIGTRTIQLDIDPSELGRNYPNAVSLCGDVKVTLQKCSQSRPASAARRLACRVPGLCRGFLGRERSAAHV